MTNNKKLSEMVLTAILSALIFIMTFVPYTGYITYGPVEITTLHIVVILGAMFLGWKGGTILGTVWGLTCLIRAFTNPLWIMFTNPLISVLPRILVGMVAGAVFQALKKTKLQKYMAIVLSSVIATLTNTVLVLSAIYIFGGMIESYATFFELFKTIITTVITVNGAVELVAAAVIVPSVYKALSGARFAKDI